MTYPRNDRILGVLKRVSKVLTTVIVASVLSLIVAILAMLLFALIPRAHSQTRITPKVVCERNGGPAAGWVYVPATNQCYGPGTHAPGQDVPAIQEQVKSGASTIIPCDPPVNTPYIVCSKPDMITQWTCEDKRSIMLQAMDGKYWCHLPVAPEPRCKVHSPTLENHKRTVSEWMPCKQITRCRKPCWIERAGVK